MSETENVKIVSTNKTSFSSTIKNINAAYDEQLTFGEKLADQISSFAGSWIFIMLFCSLLVFWMIMNGLALFGVHFDPYPFILLNLFLSSIAALQAPIIMMSQNRQAEKDRLHAENDYQVNMKAETEIANLKRKIRIIERDQIQPILSMQKQQLEILEKLEKSSAK